MRELERYVILQVVDTRWREHLENMDYLREGVHLRAMAQKDPLVEYRQEGHTMFEELGYLIHEEVVHLLFHAQLAPGGESLDASGTAADRCRTSTSSSPAPTRSRPRAWVRSSRRGGTATMAGNLGGNGGGSVATSRSSASSPRSEKIGRNDPCWCGSGKKYKKCHGA